MTHQNYSGTLAILPFVYLPLQLQRSVPGNASLQEQFFTAFQHPAVAGQQSSYSHPY